MEDKEKPKKKLMYIDYACPVGERVQWDTMAGEHFEGVIIRWEGATAIVKLDDGTERGVTC